MQSRVSIEVDFDHGNASIISVFKRESDDVRDKLVKNFIKQLGYDSNWCRIDLVRQMDKHQNPDHIFELWHIKPINTKDLVEEANNMLGVIHPCYLNVNGNLYPVSYVGTDTAIMEVNGEQKDIPVIKLPDGQRIAINIYSRANRDKAPITK